MCKLVCGKYKGNSHGDTRSERQAGKPAPTSHDVGTHPTFPSAFSWPTGNLRMHL